MPEEEGYVVTSVKIYKWQFELLKKKNLKLSTMVREWLTQYFKGADNVSDHDRYFAELEDVKEIIRKAEAKKQDIESLISKLKDEAFKLLQAKFEEIELAFKEYSELIEEAKKRVQEIEAELLERYEVLREAGGEGDLELRGLIEEVFEDVLRDGVDNWVRSKVAGERGIKVLFEKVLPNKAKERGIKLDLKKAKEIIKKYYPEIAKYL